MKKPHPLAMPLALLGLRDLFALGRHLDLSPWELLVALYIAERGPATNSGLADWSGFSSGQITHIVDRLEHDGYVKRIPHATNHRIVFLKIRAVGQHRLEKALLTCVETWKIGDSAVEWTSLIDTLWTHYPVPDQK